MKARVKATGEIIEVREVTKYDSNYNPLVYYKAENGFPHKEEQLDFEDLTQGKTDVKEKSLPKDEPDYWDKLLHQAVIAAMQGLIKMSFITFRDDIVGYEDIGKDAALDMAKAHAKGIADVCSMYATALINRLKEKEK